MIFQEISEGTKAQTVFSNIAHAGEKSEASALRFMALLNTQVQLLLLFFFKALYKKLICFFSFLQLKNNTLFEPE